MSAVPAHWDLMPRVVAIRDQISPETLILGNGDVTDLADARAKAEESGADGIMLGRGIFGNPWLFTGTPVSEIPLQDKLQTLAEFAHTFESIRPAKSFSIFKKHIKAFVTGFDGASELRAKLMDCTTASEISETISEYL
jgi:tRNA-dihydrouridine synthase